MSELSEAKAKFKELKGRLPHHTWDVEKILGELELLSDNDEEKPKEKEKEVKEAKHLKPLHSSLFIPALSDKEGIRITPPRTVLRKDWTDKNTAEYKEAYSDRLKKAMKKLA